MRKNVFRDSWGGASYGLLLKDITDSEVADNTFERNTVAIHAEGGARLDIHNNCFRSNGWAIRLLANCTDNSFTVNDFIANTFDVSTNSIRSSSVFSGNYWDAYNGYDLNRDGTGDVPYRPVRIFSYIVANNPSAVILLHSFLVSLLDLAERIAPTLTPATLEDAKPSMRQINTHLPV